MNLRFLLFAAFYLTTASEAADVRFYGVAKGRIYEQHGPAMPALSPSLPYEARAFAILNNPRVTSATIKLPNNGAVKVLTNFNTFWERRELFGSKSGVDFGMPNGSYAMVLQSLDDGTLTSNFVLSGDFYPTPAHISNYAEGQQINHQADFTLRWTGLGLNANDFIQVRLLEGETVVYETGKYPGAPDALPGNRSSLTIPRNTLAEGQKYSGRIIGWKRMAENTTGYPGAIGWAAYTARTEFTLRTAWQTTDVQWFGAMRKQKFVQSAASTPVPVVQDFVDFEAFVLAAPATELAGADIRFASGPSQSASRTLSKDGDWWLFRQGFPSEPALKQVYSSVPYEFAIQTPNNGSRSVTVEMMTIPYPGAPQISNWNNANSFDHRQAFTLSWHPVRSATVDDFIQVKLIKAGQVILETGGHPRAPNALRGNATSVSLPANLLGEGEEAECVILCIKLTDSESFEYPGALGITGSASETRSVIRARGSQFAQPSMRATGIVNNDFEFEVEAVPGRLCVFQRSADLREWDDVHITNAPSEKFLLRLRRGASERQVFYRVIEH